MKSIRERQNETKGSLLESLGLQKHSLLLCFFQGDKKIKQAQEIHPGPVVNRFNA